MSAFNNAIQTPHAFSTELVPVTDRIDAWQHVAKQVCGDCRFTFPNQFRFHGSINGRSVAGLRLTRFSSSPLAFSKLPAVSASEDRSCIAITQLQGIRRYSQSGAVVFLNPGDTTLIDSAEPWSSDCSVRCTRLYLRMPWWLVGNRLRVNSMPRLPLISGASALGSNLFRVATSLCDTADLLTPDEGAAMVEAYLAILAGCITGVPTAPAAVHQQELRARLMRILEVRLPDPSLSPSEVASTLGISTRHLHRLFAGTGSTFGAWVRELRLERCHDDLLDSHLQHRTITEIAFAWGFSDSAHFSRSFKQRYGVAPQMFRASHVKNGRFALGQVSPKRLRMVACDSGT